MLVHDPLVLIGLLFLVFPMGEGRTLQAQTIDVTVLEQESDLPIAGAMVALLDPLGAVAGRDLTRVDGRATIPSPGPGAWRLTVERIGYRSGTSATLNLAEGDSRAVTLHVPIEPIELDELRVEIDAVCESDRSGERPAALLWDEARKMLERVLWTRINRDYEFDVELYERRLGRDQRVQREESENVTVRSFRPFDTASPETLTQAGFIQVQDRDTVYFGPDAEVLLSDDFARTHCFQSVSDDHPERIGLGFEPLDSDASDIAGVLWLDKATAVLGEISFRYTGPIAEAVDRPHEGRILFRRLPDGSSIIESWWIRVPLVSRALVWHRAMPISGARRHLRFAGYRERGGVVRDIRTMTSD